MAHENLFFDEVVGLVDAGYEIMRVNHDDHSRWAIMYGRRCDQEPNHLATVEANGMPGTVLVTYHTAEQTLTRGDLPSVFGIGERICDLAARDL